MTDTASDYGTIKVPREEFERHNATRKDLGITWVEYLNGKSPQPLPDADEIAATLECALDFSSMAADPGATEEAVDDLTREVRKAQELAEQARDAAQRVEEGMGR